MNVQLKLLISKLHFGPNPNPNPDNDTQQRTFDSVIVFTIYLTW